MNLEAQNRQATAQPKAQASGVAAFTLVEVMMASGIGLMALLVIMLLSLYSSRSFAAIANYVDMDERSQLALDKMSREIRQSHRLVD